MLGLKDAYFYLIAVQITIIKVFKKIYFSTGFYNRILQSKVPIQVYFNPNPYLLSLISPYNKNSFKINEINPNNFWLKDKYKNQIDHHNFLWLNLINRKTDGKNIQKIIYLWILKYSSYKRKIWDSSTLSSRIISWILNVDIITNNGTFEFKKNFFQSIISQCNHLKKNISFEKDPLIRMEMLTALILSGLVFKDYEENFKIAVNELERFTKSYFDNDGFPLSRNPNDLIFFTKYLLLCCETIKDAQKYMPEFLDDLIEKNLACIKLIKTPENNIPLFNGGSENELIKFEKYIEAIDQKKRNKSNILGGLFFAKSKNQIVYLDVGNPPSKKFSKNYQSGALSFEYFLDGRKIITNCGFGDKISSKAELISRFTASQSTLTINDTSITKFERSKLINKVFGNSIKNSFRTNDLDIKDKTKSIRCSITHNGYEKNFGCIHKREILLDGENNMLRGTDHIFKKSDGIPIRYVLRFHLNPSLTAVKTMSGKSALIQISKNKSLIFNVENESIEIEKSIFLGGKKILDNYCITISGNLVNKNKSFNWEIKKKI
tara:strand:- start:818 stop:2461 length:1644 start_codon:yes stop_codon:yes gene_type:complete